MKKDILESLEVVGGLNCINCFRKEYSLDDDILLRDSTSLSPYAYGEYNYGLGFLNTRKKLFGIIPCGSIIQPIIPTCSSFEPKKRHEIVIFDPLLLIKSVSLPDTLPVIGKTFTEEDVRRRTVNVAVCPRADSCRHGNNDCKLAFAKSEKGRYKVVVGKEFNHSNSGLHTIFKPVVPYPSGMLSR